MTALEDLIKDRERLRNDIGNHYESLTWGDYDNWYTRRNGEEKKLKEINDSIDCLLKKSPKYCMVLVSDKARIIDGFGQWLSRQPRFMNNHIDNDSRLSTASTSATQIFNYCLDLRYSNQSSDWKPFKLSTKTIDNVFGETCGGIKGFTPWYGNEAAAEAAIIRLMQAHPKNSFFLVDMISIYTMDGTLASDIMRPEHHENLYFPICIETIESNEELKSYIDDSFKTKLDGHALVRRSQRTTFSSICLDRKISTSKMENLEEWIKKKIIAISHYYTQVSNEFSHFLPPPKKKPQL